eukprot:TRINITY_DN25919_c0_g1_i15.p1 TRINITY_DN25919_c0_g1~~TRINITY_DN25919_c0_g1_i15.p1  ORF type:complete len:594 (-),score=75.10 TRINITY_DN25919_c0_g1_i15:699-2480(-)
MQVQMNEQLERKTILQLRQQASASLVFAGIVEDYNKLQTYCKELQHRNSVLDKEGNLLRDENCNLQRDLEEAQRLAEKGFAAEKFEQKAKALEEQSSSTLKDHVKVLEDLVKCQTELQQRTAEKEQLEEELEKSQKLGQDLQQQVEQLLKDLQLEKDALQAATSEMEQRLIEKEAALGEVDALSVEKRNLEQRMVELTTDLANKRVILDEEQDEVEKMKRQLKELLEEAERDAEIVNVKMDKEGSMQNASPVSHPSILNRASVPFINQMLRRKFQSSDIHANGSSLYDRIRETLGENISMMSLLPTICTRELTAHSGTCFGLCFTRNGSFFASCGIDRAVKTWDPDTGHHQSTYLGVDAGINDISYSADSSLILGASTDKSLRVWDVLSNRTKYTLNSHKDKVWTVCCSPIDGSKAVSGGADRSIKIWDIYPRASTCHSVAVSQDGTLIISGHFDGGVRFWDMRSAKQVHELKQVHSQPVTGIVASKNQPQILTLGRDHKLRLIQQQGFNIIRTFEDTDFIIGKEMCRPCFSSDDAYIAAGSAQGKIFIWECEQGRRVSVLGQHDQSIVVCAWNPTGRQLISADNSGTIKFWE